MDFQNFYRKTALSKHQGSLSFLLPWISFIFLGGCYQPDRQICFPFLNHQKMQLCATENAQYFQFYTTGGSQSVDNYQLFIKAFETSAKHQVWQVDNEKLNSDLQELQLSTSQCLQEEDVFIQGHLRHIRDQNSFYTEKISLSSICQFFDRLSKKNNFHSEDQSFEESSNPSCFQAYAPGENGEDRLFYRGLNHQVHNLSLSRPLSDEQKSFVPLSFHAPWGKLQLTRSFLGDLQFLFQFSHPDLKIYQARIEWDYPYYGYPNTLMIFSKESFHALPYQLSIANYMDRFHLRVELKLCF